jgi:hypothetical protein
VTSRIDIQQGESLTLAILFEGIDIAEITALVVNVGSVQATYTGAEVATLANNTQQVLIQFAGNEFVSLSGKQEVAVAFTTDALGVYKTNPLLYINVKETDNLLTAEAVSELSRALLTITIDDDVVEIDTTLLSAFRGYSAYEIALQNGFEGTEEEWLQSLQGASPTYTASGAISSGRVVVCLNNTAAYFDPTSNAEPSGITRTAAINGDLVSVVLGGPVQIPGWGLTPGAVYYAGSNGTLISNPDSAVGRVQIIGVAEDANTLLVNIQPPIIL